MDVPVAWGSQSATTLDVGALRFMELRFPSALVLPSHAHDRPTLAVVMKGGFETRLASEALVCGQSSLRVEPAGSPHTNRFGPTGAHIVVVQPDPGAPLLAPLRDTLSRADHRRDPRAALIGRAIASEFRHRDAVSPLALQGLGLELVATLARSARVPRSAPPWVAQATELIHDRFLDGLRIETIATVVVSGRAPWCARSARSTGFPSAAMRAGFDSSGSLASSPSRISPSSRSRTRQGLRTSRISHVPSVRSLVSRLLGIVDFDLLNRRERAPLR